VNIHLNDTFRYLIVREAACLFSELMTAAGWQAHTVRGFVSLMGSKGGEKIESSKK
jgi:hypothetical protein